MLPPDKAYCQAGRVIRQRIGERAGERTQQLRAGAALSEDPGWFPAPTLGNSQLSVTLIPGDLLPSYDPWGHLMHNSCSWVLTHIKQK